MVYAASGWTPSTPGEADSWTIPSIRFLPLALRGRIPVWRSFSGKKNLFRFLREQNAKSGLRLLFRIDRKTLYSIGRFPMNTRSAIRLMNRIFGRLSGSDTPSCPSPRTRRAGRSTPGRRPPRDRTMKRLAWILILTAALYGIARAHLNSISYSTFHVMENKIELELRFTLICTLELFNIDRDSDGFLTAGRTRSSERHHALLFKKQN